ncbi:MAG: phosphoenolpyruvate--protein phosphotransferase [Eubacteriales bacterium]
MSEIKEIMLRGLGVSPGVGIGAIYRVQIDKIEEIAKTFTTEEEELYRLRIAVDNYCHQTYAAFQEMRDLIGREDALILGGQIMMIRDLDVMEELKVEVQNRNTAEQAINIVLTRYQTAFQAMTDEVLSQRGDDVADLRRGILLQLMGGQPSQTIKTKNPIVLCVEEITPSLMATIAQANVVAIISEVGGSTSHSAILARSMGIPAVFGVENLFSLAEHDLPVVVDGIEGTIYLNPPRPTIEKYTQKTLRYQQKSDQLKAYATLPTQTADGKAISLFANISELGQLHSAKEVGAEGVGLFRTEFLFLGAEVAPTEQEQYTNYCRLAKLMEGKPVVIRTLDVGGDKMPTALSMKREENPNLGRRAIRYSMYDVPLFHAQLRAILRAYHTNPNISILIPLIVGMEEVTWAKQQIQSCRLQLENEGITLESLPSFGVVLETPASVIVMDLLAEEVDFFSVGTNDLLQYVIAADRGNSKVATVYNPFHLSFLRMLKYVAIQGKESNIPITICGEAATDPRMIPLLLAFGFSEFSVSPTGILSVRRDLSLWNDESLQEIEKTVLSLKTPKEIEHYLSKKFQSLDAEMTRKSQLASV